MNWPNGVGKQVRPSMEKIMESKHPSHVTRFSDASTFDEICVNCGATDIVPGGWGKLAEPCPKEPPKSSATMSDSDSTHT